MPPTIAADIEAKGVRGDRWYRTDVMAQCERCHHLWSGWSFRVVRGWDGKLHCTSPGDGTIVPPVDMVQDRTGEYHHQGRVRDCGGRIRFWR